MSQPPEEDEEDEDEDEEREEPDEVEPEGGPPLLTPLSEDNGMYSCKLEFDPVYTVAFVLSFLSTV